MLEQPNLREALIKRQKIDRYSLWMYHSFENYVGKRVLDIGTGTGNLVSFYADKCDKVITTDIFPDQVSYATERFKDLKNIECMMFDICKDDINIFKKYNLDTITCINVLEHLEDDFEVLKRAKDIIVENGKVIILVPSFSWLYGTLDKSCGHYRRYDKKILLKMARELNFTVIKDNYFNLFGIIPWYLKGKVFKKEKTFSETLNEVNSKIYNIASVILEPLEKTLKIPFGMSEIIILQK